MEQSTMDAVSAVRKNYASNRRMAAALGLAPATLGDIINQRHAHVSLTTENRLRTALGLTPLCAKVEVDPCPDCGGVHMGRCNGKPVTLRPVRRRVYTDYWALPVGVLARAIRERIEV